MSNFGLLVTFSFFYALDISAFMHEGYCPPDATYGPVKQVRCKNDKICEKGKRCCQVRSKIRCIKAVDHRRECDLDIPLLKEGECPDGDGKKKGFHCKADQDCREKRICCDGICRRPKPTAHPGFCPFHEPLIVYYKKCEHDHDCRSHEKCCQKRHETACRAPVRVGAKHDRYCPGVVDDKTVQEAKLCNADSDCFGIQKCCPTTVTFRCRRPRQKAPLPKAGKCKEEQGFIPLGYVPACADDYDCKGMKKCCYQNGTIDCIDV